MIGKCNPIDGGIGRQMGIKISGGAAKLCRKRDGF